MTEMLDKYILKNGMVVLGEPKVLSNEILNRMERLRAGIGPARAV